MLQQVTCLLQHTVPQRADDDYHIVYEDGDEEDVDVVEFRRSMLPVHTHQTAGTDLFRVKVFLFSVLK